MPPFIYFWLRPPPLKQQKKQAAQQSTYSNAHSMITRQKVFLESLLNFCCSAFILGNQMKLLWTLPHN